MHGYPSELEAAGERHHVVRVDTRADLPQALRVALVELVERAVEDGVIRVEGEAADVLAGAGSVVRDLLRALADGVEDDVVSEVGAPGVVEVQRQEPLVAGGRVGGGAFGTVREMVGEEGLDVVGDEVAGLPGEVGPDALQDSQYRQQLRIARPYLGLVSDELDHIERVAFERDGVEDATARVSVERGQRHQIYIPLATRNVRRVGSDEVDEAAGLHILAEVGNVQQLVEDPRRRLRTVIEEELRNANLRTRQVSEGDRRSI